MGFQIISKIKSRESPFSLAFGIEVVLQLEIVFPIPNVENFDKKIFKKDLELDLT